MQKIYILRIFSNNMDSSKLRLKQSEVNEPLGVTAVSILREAKTE